MEGGGEMARPIASIARSVEQISVAGSQSGQTHVSHMVCQSAAFNQTDGYTEKMTEASRLSDPPFQGLAASHHDSMVLKRMTISMPSMLPLSAPDTGPLPTSATLDGPAAQGAAITGLSLV